MTSSTPHIAVWLKASVHKLVNYLASGRDTRNVVHAAAVLMGLAAFANNPFHNPVVLSRGGCLCLRV